MAESYDAIVIGARCGGSPTAMLLARKGYRVLLVDRATFPSDTVSTHFIHAPGMAALERWGLRDTLAASGCPPVRTYSFDFGPFTIAGSPRPSDGVDEAYCPRRPVLDTMLVHAAAEAGAEVREGFTVDEVLIEDGTVIGVRGKAAGGATVTEHAKVVIGADGRNSSVAKAVHPEQYNEKPAVGRFLLVLEWRRQLRLRGLHQGSLRHRRLPDPRRPHPGHRRDGRGRVQRRPQRCRGRLPPNGRPCPRTR
jgi:2-polyprenyl-6-methoxyphenol hydroxylase-like FAD-dependent oxidoreductase